MFGAGGWLVLGIALVILGFLIRSKLFEWLLEAAGLILIILGLIAIVGGIIAIATGKGRRASDF